MPGLPGHEQVEPASGGLPVLEGRDFDVDPAGAGELGHAGIRLDTQHPAASLAELAGFDPGADADVEGVASGSGRDEVVDESRGIGRPGPVVAFDVHAEGFRGLSIAVRLTPRR